MFIYEGLTLRTLEENDLERIRKLRNDPSTWTMLSDITLIDSEMQKRWFQQVRADNSKKYYVFFNKEHDFIGIVRTDEIDWINRSIRIGADVVPNLRAKGYGSKVFRLLKKYCFDYLNMHRIWLAVLDYNEIALKLYEKQGFKVEGRYRESIFRDGSYHDYIIMSILEQEYTGENQTKE